MNDAKQNSIQQAVLEKIRTGKIRRRPRLYFMLRVIVALTLGVLLFVVSALVVSFILFSLHESGEQFLLGFGWRGILVFLELFPWVYAIIAIILSVALEWLLRSFTTTYRIPLLNIFLGILGASVVLGLLISLTPLHSTLLHDADNEGLPVVGPLYEHIYDPHEKHGVYRGIATSIATSTFMLQHNDQDHDQDDGSFVIDVPQDSGIALPHDGDRILVFGVPEESGHILARNIQALSPVGD